jgi:hypothetical protein
MRPLTTRRRLTGSHRDGWRRPRARRFVRLSPAGFVVFLLSAATAQAQVTRLEILSREPMNGGRPADGAGPYELVQGRVHGEVDPADPRNTIIQDIDLAPRNARGRVEYVATFALGKPVDPARSSRTLVYQVVNRGNGAATSSPEGHLSLVSGWQGDVVPTPANQTIVVPVATRPDGSPVTGPVIARFYNVTAGTNTVPIRLSSMGNAPAPYPPADLEQSSATLTMHTSETSTGVKGGSTTIPRQAWAFADCRTTPFPGKADPTQLCLKDGFDPSKLYELVYTAKNPLVLGIGLAATRDIVSFFRHSQADAAGTANPIAGAVSHVIAIGDSQSGNFIKTFIHLGFNQDLSRQIVWDGVFPRIAARQTPINFRFALPGGAATLYEPGSEPVVWWGTYRDTTRGRPAASLLDRCTATRTCPKIVEAFGSAEFWGLRMSPGLIGTDAKRDIELPENVRRYYYPGTTHGGGRGGFRLDAAPTGFGGCTLAANPNPEADTTRALTAALIEWVVKDTQPPPSRYPRLDKGELVPATRRALGFPDLPGLIFRDSPVNPMLDYDFGGEFVPNDMSGTISVQPPRIKGTIPTYVPRVNADGNETSGVPSVLHQAPLGTYLGWNLTASGFFAGTGCGFSGGYLPFAKTRADRTATNDPRLSLEERYGTLEGYACVVERAASQAVKDRFLLKEDADRLVREASTSGVMPTDAESTAEDRNIARNVCGAKNGG